MKQPVSRSSLDGHFYGGNRNWCARDELRYSGRIVIILLSLGFKDRKEKGQENWTILSFITCPYEMLVEFTTWYDYSKI